MALTFTPQYHTQVGPGLWVRPVNPLAPFGAYPQMDLERKSFMRPSRSRPKASTSS